MSDIPPMISTKCPYCESWTDSAGFHHAYNCPTIKQESFGDWHPVKSPYTELYDIAESIRQERDALIIGMGILKAERDDLQRKLDIAKKALEEVINWDNDPRIPLVRTAIDALEKLEE